MRFIEMSVGKEFIADKSLKIVSVEWAPRGGVYKVGIEEPTGLCPTTFRVVEGSGEIHVLSSQLGNGPKVHLSLVTVPWMASGHFEAKIGDTVCLPVNFKVNGCSVSGDSFYLEYEFKAHSPMSHYTLVARLGEQRLKDRGLRYLFGYMSEGKMHRIYGRKV